MFTGIIEEVGSILGVVRTGRGMELSISSSLIIKDTKTGDSIAVNGICLTVEKKSERNFNVTCTEVTLKKTNPGILKPGARVNLERALTPSSGISGHFVQGHVDCTGTVLRTEERYPGKKLLVEIPSIFMKYAPPTGSIAINGISLTISNTYNNQLEIALVPFTIKSTNISDFRAGSKVNIEFDCLAKYTESILLKRKTTA